MAAPRRKLLYALAVIAVAGASTLLILRRRDPPIEVEVVRVEKGEVREMVSGAAAGEVKPARRALVRAEIGGTVERVTKKRGDRVEAGELIIAFSSDDFDARLQQADANLEAAQVTIAVAETRAKTTQRALERAKKLRATDAISEVELDKIQSEQEAGRHGIEQAQAAKKQAVAARKLAEVAKRRAFATAPFAGVLQDVSVGLGVQVAPAQALFDLIDDSSLKVEVPVDESDLSRIALGQKVSLKSESARDRIVAGTVSFIPPAVGRSNDGMQLEGIPLSKERSIRIEVTPEETRDLVVGASVNAEFLVSSKKDVLYVPSHVVMGRGLDRAVYQIRGGQLVRHEFRAGLTSWERTEALTGLEVGDGIVSSLNVKGLKEGARVIATTATGRARDLSAAAQGSP